MQAKDLDTLVREQVTAVQGKSKKPIDLSIGSLYLAFIEAVAGVALWLQGLILNLVAARLAATSSDTDLDSWMADYGLTRLPASAASGVVTFSRFTPTAQAIVPIGALVQTADGAQQYKVVADTGNLAYTANGYVLAPGIESVDVPVVADTAGAAGNAAANGINTIGQAMPGVDTVSNAQGFTNGADAESDAAFRARFIEYVKSLSKATKAAVGYAATSTKAGINYTLVENEAYNGTTQLGYFYLVVDDGTGYPTSELLSSVSNAVEAVRPLTSTFGVFAPVVVTANVSMTITTASDHAATVALVTTALTSYINTLPLGASLAWSRLAQVAYSASASVTNVTAVLLNSGTADLSASNKQVLKAGTVSVA